MRCTEMALRTLSAFGKALRCRVILRSPANLRRGAEERVRFTQFARQLFAIEGKREAQLLWMEAHGDPSDYDS